MPDWGRVPSHPSGHSSSGADMRHNSGTETTTSAGAPAMFTGAGVYLIRTLF